MPYDSGYRYPNHSALFRALRVHFRKRGVTNERKIDALVWRWIRQKGHRLPK